MTRLRALGKPKPAVQKLQGGVAEPRRFGRCVDRFAFAQSTAGVGDPALYLKHGRGEDQIFPSMRILAEKGGEVRSEPRRAAGPP